MGSQPPRASASARLAFSPFFGLLFLLFLLSTAPSALADRLNRCLACSACEAFASEVISRLVKLDADKDSTFQVSHRLKGYRETVKRREYRTSELRLVEALDDICLAFKDYKIAQEKDGPHRFFSKSEVRTDTTYGRDDKEFVKDSHKHLEWWCSELTMNHEDEIGELIKEKDDPDDSADDRKSKYTTALCNETLSLCVRDAKYMADQKKNDNRFWKWKAKKLEKEAAEKKKRDEEEAARKIEEEKAAAAAAATEAEANSDGGMPEQSPEPPADPESPGEL
eukprot:NODE_874_length_1726_cov_16.305307_g17_i40.p1 GENE.NODE_874_length_1726_cov_16.305307_g17_i40~~NODE_874_length_1726_cov_16.305307_g17_i40.p1  ORF type:complete len:281 (+),score=54.03 NODE_874_length_1726_cov_16.305307_g17_i40:54-896(+)